MRIGGRSERTKQGQRRFERRERKRRFERRRESQKDGKNTQYETTRKTEGDGLSVTIQMQLKKEITSGIIF